MYTIFFVGKPEWKRPLRKSKCRCENNIRMDLREIGGEGVDWIMITLCSTCVFRFSLIFGVNCFHISSVVGL
jgi:hypothetical protein